MWSLVKRNQNAWLDFRLHRSDQTKQWLWSMQKDKGWWGPETFLGWMQRCVMPRRISHYGLTCPTGIIRALVQKERWSDCWNPVTSKHSINNLYLQYLHHSSSSLLLQLQHTFSLLLWEPVYLPINTFLAFLWIYFLLHIPIVYIHLIIISSPDNGSFDYCCFPRWIHLGIWSVFVFP